MEVGVLPRPHLRPRAPVVLAVCLETKGGVVRQRVREVARVGQRRRGHHGLPLGVAGVARRRVGHEAGCRVVAVVSGRAAVGAGGAIAVAGLLQVGVDARGAVGVGVAEKSQRGRALEVQRTVAVAEREQSRSLALVADDGGGGGVDGDVRVAAEQLHERQRELVCGCENELVTVELSVGRHDRQRVAAGIGEDVRVLLQVVADAHERGGVDVGRGPSVEVQVALVDGL